MGRGRHVQITGVGMRGGGDTDQERLFRSPHPTHPIAPEGWGHSGCSGRAPPARCRDGMRTDPPVPRGMLLAPAAPPGHGGFPEPPVAAGTPHTSRTSPHPIGLGRPRRGAPQRAGGVRRGRLPGPPPRPQPAPATTSPGAQGTGRGSSQTGGPPGGGGEGSGLPPRRLPRGIPIRVPRRAAAAKSLATRSGHRGGPGTRHRPGGTGIGGGRAQLGKGGSRNRGDAAGAPTCSGGGCGRPAAAAPRRGDGRSPGCGSPSPLQAGGPGAGGGQGNAAGAEQIPALEPASEKSRAAAPHCVRRRALPVQAAPGSAARPGGLPSARLGTARPRLARLGSAPIGSERSRETRAGRGARHGSARLGLARSGSARLGLARRGSVRSGWVQRSSPGLGATRLGSARLGSAWPGCHGTER